MTDTEPTIDLAEREAAARTNQWLREHPGEEHRAPDKYAEYLMEVRQELSLS